MTHDPNLIHWQIAQYRDDESEAVRATLSLFRTIANANRQFDRGLKIGDHNEEGER